MIQRVFCSNKTTLKLCNLHSTLRPLRNENRETVFCLYYGQGGIKKDICTVIACFHPSFLFIKK